MPTDYHYDISELIDWNNPINWNHPLADGMIAWYLPVPGQNGFGSGRMINIVNPGEFTMNLSGFSSPYGGAWRGPAGAKGIWGSLYFDDASSNYCRFAGAMIAADPFTVSCWFNKDADVGSTLFFLGSSSSDTIYYLVGSTDSSGAGHQCTATKRNGGSTGTATSANLYTLNTWHHVLGTFMSNTNRSVVLNGDTAGATTNTTNVTDPTMNRTSIGRFDRPTPGGHMSGRIGSVIVWNRVLPDKQQADAYLLGRNYYAGLLNLVPEMLLGIEQTAASFLAAWAAGSNKVFQPGL